MIRKRRPSQPDRPSSTPRADLDKHPYLNGIAAKGVLVAASKRAGDTPTSTGRYWRVRTVNEAMVIRVGTGDNAYTLEQRAVSETWTPRDASDANWGGYRELGARPATAADQAAWVRDGSPTHWDLGSSDTADRHHIIATIVPGKGSLFRVQGVPAGGVFLWQAGELRLADLQAMPTSAEELRAYLLDAQRGTGKTPRGKRGTGPNLAEPDLWLFQTASSLLSELPAPPKVRAAAFQLLSGLPGVESVGKVRDPLGRTGVGIVLHESRQGIESAIQLTIEPSSGTLLSVSLKGPKNVDSIIVDSGWTNDKPTVPAATIP
jgi:hypothetical protein